MIFSLNPPLFSCLGLCICMCLYIFRSIEAVCNSGLNVSFRKIFFFLYIGDMIFGEGGGLGWVILLFHFFFFYIWVWNLRGVLAGRVDVWSPLHLATLAGSFWISRGAYGTKIPLRGSCRPRAKRSANFVESKRMKSEFQRFLHSACS